MHDHGGSMPGGGGMVGREGGGENMPRGMGGGEQGAQMDAGGVILDEEGGLQIG